MSFRLIQYHAALFLLCHLLTPNRLDAQTPPPATLTQDEFISQLNSTFANSTTKNRLSPPVLISKALVGVFQIRGRGWLGNYFSPDFGPEQRLARQGEAWREYLLGRNAPISKSTYGVMMKAKSCSDFGKSNIARNPLADRATSLIGAARRVHERSDGHKSSPLVRNVFGTARIPQTNKMKVFSRGDRLHIPDQGKKGKHIIVFHENIPYKVPLYDENGKPLSERRIQAMISTILGCSTQNENKSSTCTTALETTADEQSEIIRNICAQAVKTAPEIGALGHLPRKEYAKAYAKLKKTNPELIDDIENALFTVSLDSDGQKHPVAQTDPQKLLDFSRGRRNPGNSWVGKGLHMTVTPHGVLSECEHALSDGSTCMNVQEDILNVEASNGLLKDICNIPPGQEEPFPNGFGPMSWNAKGLEPYLARAEAYQSQQVQNTGLDYLTINIPGFNPANRMITSPSSIIQAANFTTQYQNWKNCPQGQICQFPTIGEPVNTANLGHGSRLGINPIARKSMIAYADEAVRYRRENRPPDARLIDLFNAAIIDQRGELKRIQNGNGTLPVLLAVTASNQNVAGGSILPGSTAAHIASQQGIFGKNSVINDVIMPQGIFSSGTPSRNGLDNGIIGFTTANPRLGPTDNGGFIITPTGYIIAREYDRSMQSSAEYQEAMYRYLTMIMGM